MVKRTLALFHKEIRGVSHAAYFLAGFSLVSQILAIFRDRLFASFFGADRTLDMYYAAFRIPDFIFVIVSSLVSISVLIPLIHEAENRGTAEVKRVVSVIFTAFFTVMFVIAVGVFIFIPYVIPFIFPEFIEEQDTLINITRLLLLSPILLGVSNLLASLTQVKQRFVLYGSAPVLYNIGIIFGVIVLYPLFGVMGLALGVVCGAFLHVSVQIPYLWKEGILPVFTRVMDRALLLKVMMLSLPRTLSLSVSEIVEFMLVIIAGTLSFGSISVFTLAWNLQSVPLSLIGVSYAVALFPILSKLSQEKDRELFLEKITHTLRQVIFLGFITVAVFIVVRAQIVRTVYGAGLFDWEDTRLTAAALALFTLSLVPQCAILIVTRAYYALRDTKSPFIINIISGVCTIIGVYGLLWYFSENPAFSNFVSMLLRVEDIPQHTKVLMLPLAFSIGSWVNISILAFYFNKKIPGFIRSLRGVFVIHVGSALAVGIIAYTLLNVFVSMFNTGRLLGIFGQGFLAGGLSLAIVMIILYVFDNREVHELVESITKSKRKPIAVPDTSM